MTLSARAVLLLLTVLLLALAGSLFIHTWSARDSLLAQLELRNRDAASALALALSQQRGDQASLLAVAHAHFDMGGYALVALKRQDGEQDILLQRPDPVPQVPDWFVQALPIRAEPGQAIVTHAWRELGFLQVKALSAWTYAALWQAFTRTAGLLALLGAVAAALSMSALRAWRRPLQATVAQAQALEHGRFVQAPEPHLPELRDLTRSMNSMVRRLRQVLSQQADQVATLQRQAQTDMVSGLHLREHFLLRLGRLRADGPSDAAPQTTDTALSTLFGAVETAAGPTPVAPETGDDTADAPTAAAHTASGPATSLVLLRVQDLNLINTRLGRPATDRLLAAVAQALQPYVDRVDGSFAGRLNGSDFALCLPVAGLAAETAESLHAALAAAPLLISASAQVAVGGVEVPPIMSTSAALAAADGALARAEDGTGWYAGEGVQASADDPSQGQALRPVIGGSQVWRHQIAQALSENRVELAEYVVLDAAGQVMMLQCPLRVQLVSGMEYQAAARWLALARRSRLMPQVDLKALELALTAISLDQRARCIHVSWPSLSAPGFAPEVMRRLERVPQAARRLSIEFVQSARPPDWLNVVSVMQSWRALGVQVGTEHTSASPQQLVDLQSLGVDYVKIDHRHVRGIDTEDAVKTYVQALVRLVHGLGAKAWAAGVDKDSELDALWMYGFDAATGPAVTLAHQRRSSSAG